MKSEVLSLHINFLGKISVFVCVLWLCSVQCWYQTSKTLTGSSDILLCMFYKVCWDHHVCVLVNLCFKITGLANSLNTTYSDDGNGPGMFLKVWGLAKLVQLTGQRSGN